MRDWTGGDTDYAVPIVVEARKRFLLDAMSFDRGFHSPANRAELDKKLKLNVLPKKGRLNEAERARETAPEFARMKKWRPGIESCMAISSGEAWTRSARAERKASSARRACGPRDERSSHRSSGTSPPRGRAAQG